MSDDLTRVEPRARHDAPERLGKRQRYGPNCVRDSRDLRAALAILAEREWARLENDRRRRAVEIDPALLGGRE